MSKSEAGSRIVLPGRGTTCFYFTQMERDGFSREQQGYIESLVRSYRERFDRLEITGVWDFGVEEGSPYEGEKYGDFGECRDNAVFNRDMFTISLNHIRVSRMPMDISQEELASILAGYEALEEISREARSLKEEMMNRGASPDEIRAASSEAARLVLARRGMDDLDENEGGPHNHLPLEHPLFADVWAIRRLEESMSIRRLMVHELGHAIAETYGILSQKGIRKLFASCRDGFEDLDEFCAECFMASELTDRIPLAEQTADFFRKAGAIRNCPKIT